MGLSEPIRRSGVPKVSHWMYETVCGHVQILRAEGPPRPYGAVLLCRYCSAPQPVYDRTPISERDWRRDRLEYRGSLEALP